MTDQILEEIWDKVIVDNKSKCWNWQGFKDKLGYGILSYNKKSFYAHRFVYEVNKSKIPKGLVLDHYICNNPSCINPEHMKITTIFENVMRGNGICAKYARRTHCNNGHSLLDQNNLTKYGIRKGIRQCKICTNNDYNERQKQPSYQKTKHDYYINHVKKRSVM